MNNPLISIISGTFNRLANLQQFVASVRRNMPSTLSYEIVLTDGGSTDGTIEWCIEQPDIRLIEHGALLGALKAFGDAGRAAQGEYILIANDDVVLHDNAIIAALAHLDAYPRCGGAAFLDNRPAPNYPAGYKYQTMQAFDQRLNELRSVPYGQIVLYRGWLAREIGFWGDQDSVMGTGRVYGGDNWLAARTYELGYTVDPVDISRVDDLIPNDSLREHNYKAEQSNPGVYYKAFPNPPTIAHTPQLPNPQREHLRVLLLTLYEPGYGRYKSGLRDALADVSWVVEWDYLNERGSLVDYVTAWQPHVLLMQLHSAQDITQADIAAARAACPNMVVLVWNGDVYSDKLLDPQMIGLLKHVDLQLVVNDSVIPDYREHGIHAAYWQVAFELVDYDHLPNVAKHDVVLLGNVAEANEGRRRLGNGLRGMDGVDVGLYGFGWRFANGQTTYNFAAGAALYANAKIAIGDNQFPDERGFVSNRLFEALVSGGFLLHQHVDGLEELTGLQDGVHFVGWSDFDDLQAKIRYWLNPRHAAARKDIARAGCAFVRENHSFAARVHELFSRLIPTIEGEKELA